MEFSTNNMNMNFDKYIKYLIAALILSFSYGNAQRIEIVRTDVDSTRSNFVTATYNFGVDIYIQDVEDCNGASFELLFNQTDYVIFSGSENGELGRPGEQNVRVVIEDNGIGRVIVGVGSGNPLETPGQTNPKAIHLEFVVLQSAPHHDTLRFTFNQPRATINNEGIGQIIELETEPIPFAIHSFINLWPGDTDNNGVVDHLDFNVVDLFMGRGSRSHNMRSFKRPNASSVWVAQKVLAWDSSAVTYADCDGNGEITNSDKLIVVYNLDSTHLGGIIPPKKEEYIYQDVTLSNVDPLIIKAHTESNIKAVALELEFSGEIKNPERLEFKPSTAFGKNPIFQTSYIEETKKWNVLIGSRASELPASEVELLKIYSDEISHLLKSSIIVNEIKAISHKGNIFNLSHSLTSVTNENYLDETTVWYNNGVINFNDAKYGHFELYNMAGNKVYSKHLNGHRIIKVDLNSGMYLIKLLDQNGIYKTEKLIVY